MAVTKITNLEFGKMVQAAADKLGKNAEFINSLNVFQFQMETPGQT